MCTDVRLVPVRIADTITSASVMRVNTLSAQVRACCCLDHRYLRFVARQDVYMPCCERVHEALRAVA